MQHQQYPVDPQIAASAHINADNYQSLVDKANRDSGAFWGEIAASSIDWIRPFTQTRDAEFGKEKVHIRWFADGQLNVAANCLDRHLAEHGDKTAIIWEGDDAGKQRTLTYKQLHAKVCQLANALESIGAKRGEAITIYMPMVPEAAVAMLACARIGAPHSVVFGGFSPDAIASRINDSKSKIVITADGGFRGGKVAPLKANVDKGLEKTDTVKHVLVYKHCENDIAWHEDRDIWWDDLVDRQSADHTPAAMGAEDPLFILYTSGSTGTPKGILHTTGGYLTYCAATFKYTFDYQPGEIYWCTADVGWITGHSYIVYGPLANAATVLMFEGVPSYPNYRRWGEIIERHRVNIFYTAPTAIRALMAQGDDVFAGCDFSSLRLLGSVGEPINPEAWEWFYKHVGESRHPIIDTYWQTETGGFLITPLPGVTSLKPGSATMPFPGIQLALVDNDGKLLEGVAEGNLIVVGSWPGQGRSIWGNHQRFIETYYSTYPGYYFTGDGARRDEDGYYWITGRVDDVLNVSGHRLGTAEIESSLVEHQLVAEAAVVGYPHEIKGQGIYAYVTLTNEAQARASDELKKELVQLVRKDIGPIATIDKLQWAPALPKTRSGKIMRRILRKIAADDYDSLGDTSTLAEPAVVDELISSHRVL